MCIERFANVWDAMEDTPEKADSMKLRAGLMMVFKEHITRAGLSPSEAAKLFSVTQPQASDLMRGKIGLFGLNALVSMAAAAGMQVEMQIHKAERY